MPAVTAATYAHLLKKTYSNKLPEHLARRNHRFWEMVKKVDDLDGEDLSFSVDVGLAGGISTSFSKAQANATATTGKKFTIDAADNYGVVTVSSKVMAKSRGSGAWAKARLHEVNKKLMHMGQNMAHALYTNSGNAYGVIDTIGNGLATNSLVTLTNRLDARRFYEGMKFKASADDGSSASHTLRGSDDEITVVSSDSKTGQVDFGVDITGVISGITSGDYLFVSLEDADFGNHGIAGLDAWFPLTAPGSSDSFFGVNRSTAPTRLSGHRITGAGASKEEVLQSLAGQIADETVPGGNYVILMNNTRCMELATELGSKKNYENVKRGDIGFKALMLHTGLGDMPVLTDSDCPNDRFYMLDVDTIKLHTLGSVPQIVDEDGNVALRESGADGIEVRIRGWANLACDEPVRNGVGTW